MTFTEFVGPDAELIHDLTYKYDMAIGRVVRYKALKGRSNCPWEKADMDRLIEEERINAQAFRVLLDALAAR